VEFFLEELANKRNRDRLWDIYLGTDTKDHLTSAENIRIRHIEKQLATIKRNDHNTPYLRSRSYHRPNISTSTLRRCSST
jgi:hypothetical protein